jgi:carboxymethylenebutenolidase
MTATLLGMHLVSQRFTGNVTFVTICALAVLGALFGGPARAATPSSDSDPAAEMAQMHQHDAPVPSPAVGRPGGGQEVVTRTVEYAHVGGAAVQGALAKPKNAKDGGPAVIVIQEWWGLNDNIRDMARQLASHGYTALAVDLYGGKVATDPDTAQTLMRGVMSNTEAANENLRQAYKYLHDTEKAGKIGVIGWCFGGGWSLQTGLLTPVDAVVMYYGRPEMDKTKLSALKAPVLGNFGAEDKGIPPEAVHQFEALLKELGKDASFKVYPGAGHAFANPSGKAYVKEAADDAWKRTLEFFAKHLGGTA